MRTTDAEGKVIDNVGSTGRSEDGANTPVSRHQRNEHGVVHGSAVVPQSAVSVPTADQWQPKSYTWYVIFLLSVVYAVNYMDRMALAMLMPAIKDELHLSDGQIGLLLGFAFSLCYAICGIPIARWADRRNRRNIIAISLAAWSVMTVLCGAAQNFWQLLAARVGVGIGESGGFPPAQSLLCDYVPFRRRAGVFSIYQFGLFAGMMLGMALSGWLGEIIGWRWTLIVLGLPGILLALVVWITLREPRRGTWDKVSKADDTGLSLGATIKILWACRTYKLIMLFCIANGFVQYGFNQWWPTFYTRVYGLSLSSVGVYLGLAIGIGSGIGLLAGGLMADRAAQRDVRLPLKISAVATSLALPTALASLFVASGYISIVLVGATAMFWTVSNGPAGAAISGVTMPWMRATAVAITVLVTALLGFALGPLCVGLLSDVLAAHLGPSSLRYALLAPAGVLPIMSIALYAAARNLPADLSAAGASGGDR